MSQYDLNNMDLPELKKLQTQVNNAIRTYEDRQRKSALAELEAKAQELGFSLAELTGASSKKGNVHPPKYRNPENPSQTWSGRGRQPAWIKDAVQEGRGLDAFRIVR